MMLISQVIDCAECYRPDFQEESPGPAWATEGSARGKNYTNCSVSKKTNLRSSRSGFTLIELLAAITIISILMALLLPAINKSIRQARSIICMSQQKQVHLMFMGYADNYRSRFPPIFVAGSTGSSNWPGKTVDGWHWWWREFLFYDTFSVKFNTHYPVGGENGLTYDSNTAVFRCPSIRGDPTPTLSHTMLST